MKYTNKSNRLHLETKISSRIKETCVCRVWYICWEGENSRSPVLSQSGNVHNQNEHTHTHTHTRTHSYPTYWCTGHSCGSLKTEWERYTLSRGQHLNKIYTLKSPVKNVNSATADRSEVSLKHTFRLQKQQLSERMATILRMAQTEQSDFQKICPVPTIYLNYSHKSTVH